MEIDQWLKKQPAMPQLAQNIMIKHLTYIKNPIIRFYSER